MQGFESAPGRNRPAVHERVELDRADLSRFGYSQRLFRRLGIRSGSAISFSVLSALAGVSLLYGFGTRLAGPLGLTLGWPVVAALSLAVAASLAELCSAYPTSGANYQWASALSGSGWGWFAACFNLAGLVAALAAMTQGTLQLATGIFGMLPSRGNMALIAALFLASAALVNHFGIRPAAIVSSAGAIVQIAGLLFFTGFLLAVSPQPVSSLFYRPSGSPYFWAFLPGLVVALWSLSGFDAPAHLAEETLDPRRRAPWAMIVSTAVAALAGYVFLLALLLAGATGNAPATVSAALGPRAAGGFAALVMAAIWFCAVATMASGSRTLFALARDRGTPLPGLVQPVSRIFGTPWVAVWLVAIAGGLVSLWHPGVPAMLAFSAIALQAAYLIPIAAAWHARVRGSSWPADAPWSLGRYGARINMVAIVYLAAASIAVVLPPNHAAAEVFLGLIAVLLVVYFLEARRKFAGPAWSRLTHRLPTRH